MSGTGGNMNRIFGNPKTRVTFMKLILTYLHTFSIKPRLVTGRLMIIGLGLLFSFTLCGFLSATVVAAKVKYSYGSGMIDRISNKTVIVNDRIFYFGSSTRYLDSSKKSISKTKFKVGSDVKYRILPSGSIDEIMLAQTTSQTRPSSKSSRLSSKTSNKILIKKPQVREKSYYLVNGVYKN